MAMVGQLGFCPPSFYTKPVTISNVFSAFPSFTIKTDRVITTQFNPSEKNNMNMTGWLEYFANGLRSQMKEIQEKGKKVIISENIMKDLAAFI